MKRRAFLGGAAALLPLMRSPQSHTLWDRILGAWRIRDAETVNVTTGESSPWLGRPRPYAGLIMYLPTGLMSVQIGAARPPARPDAGFGTLSSDERLAYADTWYAYYGRFEVDERQARVRHIIEGSLFAFETGRTLVRAVSFENDILTLRTVDLLEGPNGDTFNRLTWTRA
jgi:hypothetical protein